MANTETLPASFEEEKLPSSFEEEPQPAKEEALPSSFEEEILPASFEEERAEPPTTDKVKEPVTEPEDRLFAQGAVKESELEKIANKYKVSPEVLKWAVNMQTVGTKREGDFNTTEEIADVVRSMLGAGNTALGNLPYKVFTKIAYDENARNAIDEAIEIARKRRSYYTAISTGLVGPSKIAALGKAGKAGAILEGATIGAGMGYGGSKEGEELLGTTAGAVLGGTIPLVPKAALATGIAGGATGYFTADEEDRLKATAGGALLGAAAPYVLSKTIGKLTPKLKARLTNLSEKMDTNVHDNLMERADIAWEKNLAEEQSISDEVMKFIKQPEAEIDVAVAKKATTDEQFTMAVGNKLKSDFSKEDLIRAEQEVAKEVMEDEAKRLAGKLEPDKPESMWREIIDDHMTAKTGEAAMPDAIQKARWEDLYLTPAAQQSTAMVKDKSMFQYLMSEAKVARLFDYKHGTTFSSDMLQAVKNLQKLGSVKQEIVEKYGEELSKIASMPEFSNETGVRDLVAMVENPELRDIWTKAGDIEPRLADAAGRLAQIYKEVGDIWAQHGLVFRRIESDGMPAYIPHTALNKDTAIARMNNLYEKYKMHLASDQAVTFAKSGEDSVRDFRDFIQAAEWLTDKSIDSTDDLNKAMRIINSDADARGVARLKYASQTMSRDEFGEMPELLRDYNILRGFDRYLNGAAKEVALREPVKKIMAQANALEKSGNLNAAEYMRGWVKDQTTGGKQPLSTMITEKYRKSLGEKLAELEYKRHEVVNAYKEAGKTIQVDNPDIQAIDREIAKVKFSYELPDAIMQASRSIVHGNMLGGKLKVPIADLLQPFTMGITEIGGKYGTYAVGNGTLAAAKDIANIKNWARELVAEGLLEPKAAMGVMADTIEQSGIRGLEKIKSAAELYSRLATAPKMMAEVVNRKVMLETAKGIVSDYLTGNNFQQAGARRYIEKFMGKGTYVEVQKLQRLAEKTGDMESYQKQLTKLIQTELVDATQFTYSPMIKSKMARTLGPTLAQFTKYSSEVLGDMVLSYHQRGKMQTAVKALAPTASLVAINAMYQAATDGEEIPAVEALTYKGGAVSRSPLASIPGVIPAVGPAFKTLTSLAKAYDDPKEGAKAFKDLDNYFMPKAAFNFASDLATILTNEKQDFYGEGRDSALSWMSEMLDY